MKHTPLGYEIIDGQAIIGKEAVQVRKLFDGTIKGMSLADAAKYAGLNYVHSSVKRILANKKYLGTDYYPQLIDEETFQLATEIRQKSMRVRRCKERKPIIIPTEFKIQKAELSYEDPYEQAKYIYRLIEEA